MAASFPVTFPSALTTVPTTTLESAGHNDNLHVKDRDEIIATQQKLGLGSSTATGTLALLGTGGTQSAWGQITNTYVSGTAAIAYSKLALGTSIVNADIAAAAGIAVSKIAALGAGNLIRGNAGANDAGPLRTAEVTANAISQSGVSIGLDDDVINLSATSYFTIDGNGTSDELRVDLTTTSGSTVLWWLTVTVMQTTGSGDSATVTISVDGGTELTPEGVHTTDNTNRQHGIVVFGRITGLSAAAHVFRARCKFSGGTWTMNGIKRSLLVREDKTG